MYLISKIQIFTNNKKYDQTLISGKNDYSKELEDILMSFVICNNLRIKGLEDGDFIYEGSSPDEIALGDFAKEMNFIISERNEKRFTIKNYLSNDLKDKFN